MEGTSNPAMSHANKIATEIYPCAVSSDRISSLPEETRSQILSYLNAEEAVRASILSSIWNGAWTTMPQILLCDTRFGYPESSRGVARSKFVTLVDLTLSLHDGPLEKFSIKGRERITDYHDVFDRWMYKLSMKKPRHIRITLCSLQEYKIPSRLFRISGLEHLHLGYCIISLPRMFEGFNQLKVLKLISFLSTDDDISNLISNCPLLATLVLVGNNWDIYCLNIRAQALQLLEVEGNFEVLHLHAPNLVRARLVSSNHTEDDESDPLQHESESHLRQAFGSLTRIKKLTVNYSFLMYPSKGCLLTELPGAFDHLELISIEGCLQNWEQVMAACALFKNAPILSKLEIWSQHLPEHFMPKRIFDEDYSDIQAPTLDRLVTITFHKFMGWDCEIALLGSLLSWASALEEVTIDVDESMTNQGVIYKAMKKLLAFPRASAKAKVVFT